MTAPIPRPVVKWAGGKTQLLTRLLPRTPQQFHRYYEPFAGGAAVLLALQPCAPVLGDINAALVWLYRYIQLSPDDLIVKLRRLREIYWNLPAHEQRNFYYAMRARYNLLPPADIDKVALLVFLNKTAFNGLYRENSQGHFNAPFGCHERPVVFDAANIAAVSEVLRTGDLRIGDFRQTVADAAPGDFVYFDPPYAALNPATSFTGYASADFLTEQQVELARLARCLSGRGVSVMLSNADTSLVRFLYRGFSIESVPALRAINRDGAQRGPVSELVIRNY
jgi:DNA adenine methylase